MRAVFVSVRVLTHHVTDSTTLKPLMACILITGISTDFLSSVATAKWISLRTCKSGDISIAAITNQNSIRRRIADEAD